MKKRYIFLFLGLITVMKITFSAFPQFGKMVFNMFLYPYISFVMRILWGFIPFSVGDILYPIIVAFLIGYPIYRRKLWKRNKLQFIGVAILPPLLLVAFFYILWGFNYYQPPLTQRLKYKETYDFETLISATDYFLTQSNQLHAQITDNDSTSVDRPMTLNQLRQWSKEVFQKLYQQQIVNQKYNPISLKATCYPTLLSYMGYSGYLNPFTGEAQINTKIPDYQKPITAFHEVAHQLGFALESEANFIGCCACLQSSDPYVRYSGAVFALKHCLIEIRKRQPELYNSYLKQLRKGILKDFQKSRDFWAQYQNPLAPLFTKTYDTYLKIHRQHSGMNSYHEAVNLLLGYYSTRIKNVPLTANP